MMISLSLKTLSLLGLSTLGLPTLGLIATPPLQGGGSRAGAQNDTQALSQDPVARPLADANVQKFIRVVGKVEIRIRPDRVRVVLAIMTEGKEASTCEQDNKKKRDALVAVLKEKGFQAEELFLDFISILPVYSYRVEDQHGQQVVSEKLQGYRMQSNLHISAKNEAQARGALREAFKLDIPDIIAFDYWSKDLDKTRANAQSAALKEALRKASLLLVPLFDVPPKPINVSEDTKVIRPKTLYVSSPNVYEQTTDIPYNHRLPVVRAAKPKNTYYKGAFFQSDLQGKNLPMAPEISVISIVQLYYPTTVTTKVEPKQVPEKQKIK